MIKVIIERKVAPECLKEYQFRAASLYRIVLTQPGFISSELLANLEANNHRYVIVSFDNIHNWKQWYKSLARADAMAEINAMLEEPEKITVMEYLARS